MCVAALYEAEDVSEARQVDGRFHTVQLCPWTYVFAAGFNTTPVLCFFLLFSVLS